MRECTTVILSTFYPPAWLAIATSAGSSTGDANFSSCRRRCYRSFVVPSGEMKMERIAIVTKSSPTYANKLSKMSKHPNNPYMSWCRLEDSITGMSRRISSVKQKGNGLNRGPKVLAYYGLRTPPYKLDALEPYMSKRTLEIHWGEHHRGYIEALNKHLGKNDVLYGYTLDELVKVAYNNGNPMAEFNDAAQVWNHDFFWDSMQPGGGDSPKLGLLAQIEKDFGSFTNFKEKFTEAALSLFGSGWVWLVLKRNEKRLEVVKTVNAVSPIIWDDIPIICLDMWEHAYYLDFQNDRAKYVNTFLNHLVSWHAAAVRIVRAHAFVNLGEPKIPVD